MVDKQFNLTDDIMREDYGGMKPGQEIDEEQDGKYRDESMYKYHENT